MIHSKIKSALFCFCLVSLFSLDASADPGVILRGSCIEALQKVERANWYLLFSSVKKAASKQNISPYEYLIRYEYHYFLRGFKALRKFDVEIPERFSTGETPIE